MWEENWIVPWRNGVRELGSGGMTGWCPGLRVLVCPKFWADWRVAGLDLCMSTVSKDKGIFGMRSTLLPGLGGQEHPNPYQFQAQLNILLLVNCSCRFVRCVEAAPLTIPIS